MMTHKIRTFSSLLAILTAMVIIVVSTLPVHAASVTTALPSGTLMYGIYLVGQDIGTGEYLLSQSGTISGYFEVTSDATGSFNSIVSNGFVSNRAYITVLSGQYLKLERCTTYPSVAFLPYDGTKGYTDGEYLVGKDILPGTYKVIPTGIIAGYYEVNKDSYREFSGIVSNKLLNLLFI
jgi:hypothetical protein